MKIPTHELAYLALEKCSAVKRLPPVGFHLAIPDMSVQCCTYWTAEANEWTFKLTLGVIDFLDLNDLTRISRA